MNLESNETYAPLYVKIKETVIERIRSGIYPNGEKLPARSLLAKEFNTTTATCSRAVNDLLKEEYLESKSGIGTFISSKPLEKRIQIYVVVRDLDNPIYLKFANTVDRLLSERSMSGPKLINLKYNYEREVNQIRKLINNEDAYFFMYGYHSEAMLRLICEYSRHFYVLGPAPELQGRTNTLRVNRAAGAYQAVKHLLENGHRRIGIILRSRLVEAPGKSFGWDAALQEYGLEASDADIGYIVREDDNYGIVREATLDDMRAIYQKLMLRCDRPTAFFCASDHLAMLFISLCQLNGLRIPEDASVCSYDGAFDQLTGALQYSTVVQPFEELINHSLDHLFQGTDAPFLNEELSPALRKGMTVKKLC